MYTIKILIWKGQGSGPATRACDDTTYIAGKKIITAMYVSEDERVDVNVLDKKILEERNISEAYFPHYNETANRILFISYFDEKGEYRTIILHSTALVYIMQDGKTIDKIIV